MSGPCTLLMLQLYDASNSPATKLGEPVVLNVTGSGTAANPFQATLGPFSQPVRITAAVQATGGAGGSSTGLSANSTAVVVGEWRSVKLCCWLKA